MIIYRRLRCRREGKEIWWNEGKDTNVQKGQRIDDSTDKWERNIGDRRE